MQVSKLRVLKQSYLSEHYDLEDKILKYYPQEGNLIRIENELAKLPVKLETVKTRKAETESQLETAKEEVKKPFAFEEELKEKNVII